MIESWTKENNPIQIVDISYKPTYEIGDYLFYDQLIFIWLQMYNLEIKINFESC